MSSERLLALLLTLASAALVARELLRARPDPTPSAEDLVWRIEINEASEAELALLPGIGPARAAALVRLRREKGGFRRWEELEEAPGIGPITVARLQETASLTPPRSGYNPPDAEASPHVSSPPSSPR